MIWLLGFNLEFGWVECELIFFPLEVTAIRWDHGYESTRRKILCEFNIGLEIQFDLSLWAVCGAAWVCIMILKSVLMSCD